MVEITYKNKGRDEVYPTDTLFNKYEAAAEQFFGDFEVKNLSEFGETGDEFMLKKSELIAKAVNYLIKVERINAEQYGKKLDENYVEERMEELLGRIKEQHLLYEHTQRVLQAFYDRRQGLP